jgi:hypothetical protein
MLLSRHLTPAPIDEVARLTHPGMASWAVPDTPHCCGDCIFWDRQGRAKKLGRLFGVPEPRQCRKYFMLMNKTGAAVPYDAMACRVFEKPA